MELDTEYCEICKKDTLSFTKDLNEWPIFCAKCKQPRS